MLNHEHLIVKVQCHQVGCAVKGVGKNARGVGRQSVARNAACGHVADEVFLVVAVEIAVRIKGEEFGLLLHDEGREARAV